MMFSQLCRARPKTLWNKIAIRQPATGIDESQRVHDLELNGDDSRCQLEHCTFCDYRVCCQVTSCSSCEWEEATDPDLKVTENPAYGLSSKNWLEINEGKNDTDVMPHILSENMESFSKQNERNENHVKSLERLKSNSQFHIDGASQKEQDCDANTVPMKMNFTAQSYVPQNKMECKPKSIDESVESSKPETHIANDQKHGSMTWSVLRHRNMSGDALKNCDNKSNSCVIEHSICDILYHDQPESQEKGQEMSSTTKPKRNIKDRSFPLSLMRPIAKIGDKKTDMLPPQFFSHGIKNDLSRQRPVQRTAREKFQIPLSKETEKSKKLTNDLLGMNNPNPLSEIAQIKTEESIQEWLARIGDSGNKWPDDSEDKTEKSNKLPLRSPWHLISNTDEEKSNGDEKYKQHSYSPQTDDLLLDNSTQHSSEMSHNLTKSNNNEQKHNYQETLVKDEEIDANTLLCNASKASPANVPMVVMQCSRLHSHIGCKPPFQQTSLPMGTLITALYQESDWLYVQTPHGVEGYLTASNCVPIGTVNDPSSTSRRPWEPCDFPIQVSMRKKGEFGRQQGSYIHAKLPTNNGKQAAPYVSTVKMKTNFYSDRYFSHTFKSKDSIKTAKTVTDILRSSPETKISN